MNEWFLWFQLCVLVEVWWQNIFIEHINKIIMHLQWCFVIVDNVIELDLKFRNCSCSFTKLVTMISCFVRRYIIVRTIWLFLDDSPSPKCFLLLTTGGYVQLKRPRIVEPPATIWTLIGIILRHINLNCWVRRRYCLAGITKLGEWVAKNTKLE